MMPTTNKRKGRYDNASINDAGQPRANHREGPPPAVNDNDELNIMETDAVQTTFRVYVVVDGKCSNVLEINVMEGDSIFSMKEKIKEKATGSPDFDFVPAYMLQLFKSKEYLIDSATFAKGEAVAYPMEWIRSVDWGTKQQPLIVETPPTTSRSGECCFACACVC